MKKLLIIILSLLPIILTSQEICNNGIDDDGDGLIDLHDDECECEGFSSAQNVPSLIPNYSFEDHSCCPGGYSQLNCADTWQQASGNTSDYFNTCGFTFEEGDEMSGEGFVHTTPFEGGFTYHIKCRDEFNNIGAGCSAIVKPSENFL